MVNATRSLFSGESDEAHRLAAELVSASAAPANNEGDARTVLAVIDDVRRASGLPYRDDLVTRLEILLDAFNEDYDGEVFSAASLRGMLGFLESVPSLPFPSLTLTPRGESCASWESGRGHAFNALFLDAQRVRFFIIYPNTGDTRVSDKLSGSTTPASLPELVSYVRLSDWAAQ